MILFVKVWKGLRNSLQLFSAKNRKFPKMTTLPSEGMLGARKNQGTIGIVRKRAVHMHHLFDCQRIID